MLSPAFADFFLPVNRAIMPCKVTRENHQDRHASPCSPCCCSPPWSFIFFSGPPSRSGTACCPGCDVAREAVIERSPHGVPTIKAGSRTADLFFAIGFAHAQDRLFQMDLQRRAANGRLAEVLGAQGPGAGYLAALSADRCRHREERPRPEAGSADPPGALLPRRQSRPLRPGPAPGVPRPALLARALAGRATSWPR